MKYRGETRLFSYLNGDLTPVCLWEQDQDEENLCELQDESQCDDSGVLYGTDDSRDPKFCARHFYQNVVNGNGKTNYKLVDNPKK